MFVLLYAWNFIWLCICAITSINFIVFQLSVLSLVESHSLEWPTRPDTVNSLMSAASQIKQILVNLFTLCFLSG